MGTLCVVDGDEPYRCAGTPNTVFAPRDRYHLFNSCENVPS